MARKHQIAAIIKASLDAGVQRVRTRRLQEIERKHDRNTKERLDRSMLVETSFQEAERKGKARVDLRLQKEKELTKRNMELVRLCGHLSAVAESAGEQEEQHGVAAEENVADIV